MTKFKVTAEGRLLRKEVERQKLTHKERQEKADEYGYDSWSELVTSEDIDELTVEDSWWVDHNFHGEFQFTANQPEELTDDGLEGVQNVYKAKFEKGELVEIEFVERRRFY